MRRPIGGAPSPVDRSGTSDRQGGPIELSGFRDEISRAAARRRRALVLSGGNALGAYQAGAFETLNAAGVRPEWVVGASIGAVNAAIVVGGPPEEAVSRLRAFWAMVAEPGVPGLVPRLLPWRRAWSLGGAAFARLFGRPGLFEPRLLPGSASLYDLAPLERTLERLVDFDRIGRGEIRLTITATDAETGEEVLFDNRRDRIRPRHVLASCAWPPDFPPVEIDGRHLLDAGLVANMPLDVVLGAPDGDDWLCIAVDLFDTAGPRPRSVESALQRRQELLLAGQSARVIRASCTEFRLRRAVRALAERLPREALEEPGLAALAREGRDESIVLIRVPYHGARHESAAKMFDYSRSSIEDRWRQGRDDMQHALPVAAAALSRPRRPGLSVHEVRPRHS